MRHDAPMGVSELLEKAFACLVMLLMTGAGIPLMAGGLDYTTLDMTEGVAAFQWLTAGCYLLSGLLCLRHVDAMRRMIRPQGLLWLLLLWTGLSVAWSIEPGISLRRVVATMGSVVFVMWVVCRFSPMEILRLLAVTLGLAAAASLVAVALSPGLGVHPPHDMHAGTWRGVFIHKNVLARSMSLGVLVFAWLLWMGVRRLPIAWLGMALCVVTLLGAGSRTAWITTMLFVCLPPLIRFLRLHWSMMLGLTTVGLPLALIVGLAVWVSLDDVLALMGRDLTLTGRTNLWLATWQYVQGAPWMGYGFRVFWLQQNDDVWVLWSILGWDPGSAHNSFLELLLDLGVIGLALFALGAIQGGWRILHLLRRQDVMAGWYLSFFMYMMLQSVSQSLVLTPNTLQWTVYLMVLVLAGDAFVRHRADAPACEARPGMGSLSHAAT